MRFLFLLAHAPAVAPVEGALLFHHEQGRRVDEHEQKVGKDEHPADQPELEHATYRAQAVDEEREGRRAIRDEERAGRLRQSPAQPTLARRELAIDAQQARCLPGLMHHEDVVGGHTGDHPDRSARERRDGPLLEHHVDDEKREGECEHELHHSGEREEHVAKVEDHEYQDEQVGDAQQDPIADQVRAQLPLRQRPVTVDDVRVHVNVRVLAQLLEQVHELEGATVIHRVAPLGQSHRDLAAQVLGAVAASRTRNLCLRGCLSCGWRRPRDAGRRRGVRRRGVRRCGVRRRGVRRRRHDRRAVGGRRWRGARRRWWGASQKARRRVEPARLVLMNEPIERRRELRTIDGGAASQPSGHVLDRAAAIVAEAQIDFGARVHAANCRRRRTACPPRRLHSGREDVAEGRVDRGAAVA